MKSFDKELKKYSEKIRLRAIERRDLRERVLSYMEYHPLPKKQERLQETIASQPFFILHFNTVYTRIAAGAILVLLLVVVPIAAERSVPGDVLYLVKTGINENIQSQLANTPYEKVAFETKLLERRISEARLLASEGKLTKNVEESLAQDVKEHADAAQAGLDELRSSDSDGAAIAEITFDSALEVQSAVLDSDTTKNGTSTTKNIADAVKAAQVEATQKKSSTTPSYDGLMARVETETTRAEELYDSIKGSATDDERNDIERRLADIDRKVTGAKDLSETDTGAATSQLADALSVVQKLIAFMTDIDVRENVALDKLVPVELTPEERTNAVNGILENIEKLQDAVEARALLIESDAILEKVHEGLGELKTRVGSATSSLAAGNIDEAEKAVVSAFALADDLDQLTMPYIPNEEGTSTQTGDGSSPEATSTSAVDESASSTSDGTDIETDTGSTTAETGSTTDSAAGE